MQTLHSDFTSDEFEFGKSHSQNENDEHFDEPYIQEVCV